MGHHHSFAATPVDAAAELAVRAGARVTAPSACQCRQTGRLPAVVAVAGAQAVSPAVVARAVAIAGTQAVSPAVAAQTVATPRAVAVRLAETGAVAIAAMASARPPTSAWRPRPRRTWHVPLDRQIRNQGVPGRP